MKNRCLSLFILILGLVLIPTFVKAEEYTGTQSPLSFTSPGTYEITLKDAVIDAAGTGKAGIEIGPGVKLIITLEGDNTISGDNGFAGIAVLPEYDSEWNYLKADSGYLVITGSGNLSVNGGSGDITTGTFGGGAAIGGNGQDIPGDGVDFGTVEIAQDYAGVITAVGGKTAKYLSTNRSFGAGAGIGTGGLNNDYYNWGEVQGTIIINGGTVNATGGLDDGNGYGGAAGIGSGGAHGNGQVLSSIETTINGGIVKADGTMAAAGIGGGSTLDGGTIIITGGEVTANSGENDGPLCGAGIGGGDSGTVTEVRITGGKVIAKSKVVAGIGGGSNTNYSLFFGEVDGNIGNVSKIIISGQDTYVEATGGTYISSSNMFGGPGIGSGYSSGNTNRNSVAYDIQILDGAQVIAHGGLQANSIGYGCRQAKPTATKPEPVLVTGYGVKLTLSDDINIFADNLDDIQTPLVSPTAYDENPITFVSSRNYLISYTAEGKFRVYSPITQTYSEVDGIVDNNTATIEIDGETLEVELPTSYSSSLFSTIYIKEVIEEDNTETEGTPITPEVPTEENVTQTPDNTEVTKEETNHVSPTIPENPKTYDGIAGWIVLLVVSACGLFISQKKKSNL